jgi:trehalose 6-phosphate phosphatase
MTALQDNALQDNAVHGSALRNPGGAGRLPRLPPPAEMALFLDFDGTLVEIVAQPDEVQVEPAVLRMLAGLHRQLGGALALLSGRRIAALDRFLAPLALDAAGLHGLELRRQGALDAPGPDRGFRQVAAALGEHAATRYPALLIEDKGASVALHWRQHPELETAALRLAEAALDQIGAGHRLQHGHCVVEILPARADKGQAVRWFMESAPYRGRRPVVCGDDLTDEAAFIAANAAGGMSVKVGEGQTAASHRVESQGDLVRLLVHASMAG